MNQNIVTGIDIGGSHITVALVDLNKHEIVRGSSIRRAVRSKECAEIILGEWVDAIHACKDFYSDASSKIGIAMPGPFDYEKGICLIKDLDKYDSLFDLNIKEILASKLKINRDNILMMNDASCFLKGELFARSAHLESQRVIGITLGTGLGSAVYKDGMMYSGDLYKSPFRDSTAEEYLCSRWFVDQYKKITGKSRPNVKSICEVANGNPEVLFLFKEFGRNLGDVLLGYIKKHRADTVIIGGNISNAWDLFILETFNVLHTSIPEISLIRAQLGEEAALLGAGSLYS